MPETPESSGEIWTRRQVLRAGGIGAAGLGLSGLLAGCGGSSKNSTASGATQPAGSATAAASAAVASAAATSASGAASAAATSASGAASAGGSGTIEVALPTGTNIQQAGLIAKFQAAFPQYRVNITETSYGPLHDKLVASFAGGSVPDVALVADQDMGEFALLNALAPLDDFKAKNGYNDADFLPGSWSRSIVNNKLYGAPAYYEARGIFYRTDYLQQAGISAPPKTLDELVSTGKALSNGSTRFGIADQTGQLDQHFLSCILYEMGGGYYNSDGTASTINNSTGVDAFAYYKSLYDQNIIPKDPTKRANPWLGFKNGLYAMAESGGFWFSLLNAAPNLNGKWTVAPFPSGPANIGYGHPQPWIIPAKAKNSAGAQDWIAFMLKSTSQADWFPAKGFVPSVLSAYNDPRLSSNAPLLALRAAAQKTNSIHDVRNGEAITVAVSAVTSQVKNGMAPKDAASSLAQKINQLLKP